MEGKKGGKEIMIKKYLLIIPLFALVGFLFFSKISLVNGFENITPEEAGKYLELSGKDAEKILSTLIQTLTTKGINLLSSTDASDEEIAVVGILREAARIDVLNHLLIDAPIEITGKIIKSATEIARLLGAKDISVVLEKFEKETVKMAVDYGMKVLLQNEIRVTPGAIVFKYISQKGEEKEAVFQYLIIYQPLDANLRKVEIRFYSSNYIESPERKQSIGFAKGIYHDLQHDLPPFIVEISGEVEETDLGGYYWVKGPSIKITFPDSVPDFGLKPLSAWEKYLLKPIETAIKEIEVIITKATGKSLGLLEVWNEIKSFFSKNNPFLPAAIVETQLIEKEPETEDLEVKGLLTEAGQDISEEPEAEPELTDGEIQEILDNISEETEKTEEAEEIEEEEPEEEPDEDEDETELEETSVIICERTSGDSPVRNKIIINEVAWMGTINSANDEWIELKNLSSGQINLAGWQLLNKEKQIKIFFEEGIIPAGGFYLLERTDDNSVPNIAADFIYTGGLGNTEEFLYLFDENCQFKDEVAANPDWSAGDNSSKRTMERKNNLDWQTSSNIGGTPKSENSGGYYEYQGGGYSPPPEPEPEPEPEPVCDSENIDLCITQELCKGVNLYWYDETCNLEPEPLKILITEIQITGEGDEKEEFVELYNPNQTDVNLTGWYIQRKTNPTSDYSTFASNNLFSEKTIKAKDYFLIARQGSSFINLADVITDYPLTENNTLVLKVLKNQNRMIDEVSWGEISAGRSYGRKWDESTQEYTDFFELQIPTPKARNQPLPPEEPPSPELTYLPAIGHNSPGMIIGENEYKWEDEPLAYDDSTDTFAKVWTFDWHNSPWLELFAPPKQSQGIRFWLGPWVNYGIHPRIGLFYDGDWHFLTEWREGNWRILEEYRVGAIPSKGEWIEIDYPEEMVEKARIMFGPNTIGSRGYAQLHEFQFKTSE